MRKKMWLEKNPTMLVNNLLKEVNGYFAPMHINLRKANTSLAPKNFIRDLKFDGVGEAVPTPKLTNGPSSMNGSSWSQS
jgi:hypothetical protein